MLYCFRMDIEQNLLADGIVRVDEGLLPLSGEPVIIKLGRN